jgi:hypothetical protein
MTEQEDREKFKRWLPWYVNDTLSNDERTWMDAYLREHSDAQKELRLERLLRTAVREIPFKDESKANLSQFLARINSVARQPDKFRGSKFIEWVQCLGLNPRSPAMAVMSVLLLFQISLVIAFVAREPVPGQIEVWRSAERTPYKGPFLKITFKPKALEEQIRFLLVENHGILVSGPDVLGNYIVRFPADKLEDIKKEINNSTFVMSVEQIETLPISD